MRKQIPAFFVLAVLAASACQSPTPKDSPERDAIGVIEDVANATAPFLPPPWNTIVMSLLGIGAAVAEAKRRQTKGAFKQAVGAIEQQKIKNNGVVDFKDDTVRASISLAQGKFAKKIVDEVQGKSKAGV